jgi:sortase (surface protein transpeptidase)
MFDVNDEVVVTTWNGRKMTYTIKDWEAIQDNDFEELNDTCIWLKDGTA